MTEIELVSSGRRLAARIVDGGGGARAAPAILFVHGLHSDQGGYAERAHAAAAGLGAVCLTFDLAGHGASDGDRDRLSVRDHLGDALQAYDRLAAAPGFHPRRVGVCAASYGAYLAALLAGERPVRRMLLRAPALYADDLLDVPLGERERPDGPPDSAAGLDNLAALDGEVLVLESERDAVIPHATIEAYLAASPRVRHEVIADATHNLSDPAWRAQFTGRIVSWFGGL